MKKVVSFSGGESSGLALIETLKEHPDAIVVFMNTSKEREETLEFINKVSIHFNINVVWIEAVFDELKSIDFRITNYKDAKRNGEVFEDMIKCYGLPNKAYPHCNRELKIQPFDRFMKSLNVGDFERVIGIRADEVDRVNKNYKELRLDYILVKKGITKQMVNKFWNEQPFRLQLKGYEGNCTKCWKKSLRKLMTIEKDEREGLTPVDLWWHEMEKKYSYYVPEHRNRKEIKEKITFYRENLSNKEIVELSQNNFQKVEDDSIIYDYQTSMFGYDLDDTDGCVESCEII